MYFIAILISLFTINKIILFLQNRVFKPQSDHPYHIGLINGIRCNNHRFVKKHPNFICEKNFAYPQFFHWCLSFFSEIYIRKHYHWIIEVINFITLFSFLFFTFTIYPFLSVELSREIFVLIAGLVYILTPFSFALWNAKNAGISTRGFGLMLGMIYQFLITYYIISDNNYWLLPFIFLIVFIILVSSQFAFQFVILSSPFFSLGYKNLFFLIMPLIAVGMFFLIMPKVAENWIKGQYWHKMIYYKYLAKILILKNRYSIWRDFIWDFWNKLNKDFKSSIFYIYYNPLVSVCIGFPTLMIMILFFSVNRNIQDKILNDEVVYVFFVPILVSLIIFLFTSFRRTRFLGEPERYVEFTTPYISILGVFLLGKNILLIGVIITISIILIIFQFIVSWIVSKKNNHEQNVAKIKKIIKSSVPKDKKILHIFSNNIDLLKFFLDNKRFKILIPNLTSLYTGKFHFKEIFPETYITVSSKIILPLIKEFEIDCFILDTNYVSDTNRILKNEYLLFEKIGAADNFIIFRVCSKN